MTRNLGISGTPSIPPALRASTPGWRDPRLWIGLVIIAVSVVAGARLFAAADDSVAVWSVSADMGAGDQVTESDLVARRVRFAEAGDLDRYFRASDALPSDLELLHGVGEGELLPRAAVGDAAESNTQQISIEVEPGKLPSSVAPGSVVDIWLVDTDASNKSQTDTPEPALEGVTVVDVPAPEESFGSATGRRAVVLAVPAEDVGAYYGLLAGVPDPNLSVARHSQ